MHVIRDQSTPIVNGGGHKIGHSRGAARKRVFPRRPGNTSVKPVANHAVLLEKFTVRILPPHARRVPICYETGVKVSRLLRHCRSSSRRRTLAHGNAPQFQRQEEAQC
jgi:hypothetical protein